MWQEDHALAAGLVAVFPQAAVGVNVVGLGALALDAGAVHGSNAAQLVVRVTPAAQARLKAIWRTTHSTLFPMDENMEMEAHLSICKIVFFYQNMCILIFFPCFLFNLC